MTAGEGNRLRAGLLAISIAKEAFAQASLTHTQPGYQDGSVKPQWPQGALLDLQMLVLGKTQGVGILYLKQEAEHPFS